MIKLFPIIRLAEADGTNWGMVFTGQGPTSFMAQWEDFGFPAERCVALVARHEDLKTPAEAALWLARALLVSTASLRERIDKLVRFSDRSPYVVHGDTLSTLAGAIHGRRLGATVAHVEAGVRSGRLRDPFPEEINRTLVSQVANLHFAPDSLCENHLKRERVRGRVIVTNGNTQLDAIDSALNAPSPHNIPNGEYGLVNIHRFETLVSPERRANVKRVLLKAGERHRLVMVSHETTMRWLQAEERFVRSFEANGGLMLPRQPFLRFAHWLGHAQFVIADSGGNQQECSHLGIPCLLLRMVTETPIRPDRRCVVLSHFQESVIDGFLADPKSFREPRETLVGGPSECIWRVLKPLAIG